MESVPDRVSGRASRPWRIVVALTVAIASVSFGAAPAAAADELLPDLKMGEIYNVRLQRGQAGRVRLRFGTIVWNVGDGPLEVRANQRVGRVMEDVVQWISTRNGGGQAYVPPGAAAFYAGDGHDHWHIKTFIVLSLYSKTGNPADPEVSPTYAQRGLRKIGFCLTDLVRAPPSLRPQNAAARVRYPVSGCGTDGSTSVKMGISAGYGDDYKPHFNHQLIDITSLPTGTYRMCATVNETGLWREKNDNLDNNSSWVDLEIDADRPSFRIIETGDTDCGKRAPLWFGVGG